MERPTRSPSEPSPGRRAGQRSAAAESVDKRPEAAARGKLIDAVDNSPRMLAQRQQLRSMFGDAVQLQGGPEEDELLQGKWATIQRQGPEDEELQMKAARSPLAQLQAEPPAPGNSTGLPDKLKSGIESLSGISMDHVNVHYNSPQPAQLNALAYAQGSDIHVAPGQEQHLPHEAWHLVQQAQGRVRPTMQMKDGVPVNDDKGLEHEADVMGQRAVQPTGSTGESRNDDVLPRFEVTGPRVTPTHVSQLGKKKGGKKEGTFIGDRKKIHVHIDIGKPHMMLGGERYDLQGRDVGGVYGRNRINEAIAALLASNHQDVSGYAASLAWLQAQ